MVMVMKGVPVHRRGEGGTDGCYYKQGLAGQQGLKGLPGLQGIKGQQGLPG